MTVDIRCISESPDNGGTYMNFENFPSRKYDGSDQRFEI